MGIMSIPTLMVFREGVLVFSQPGALPGGALEELIAKVRQLDMEEVHRAVAAHAASRARARHRVSPSPPDQGRVHLSAVQASEVHSCSAPLRASSVRRLAAWSPEAAADPESARYGRLVGATLGAEP